MKCKRRCRADISQSAGCTHVRQLCEEGRHSRPHAPLVASGGVDENKPALQRLAQSEASQRRGELKETVSICTYVKVVLCCMSVYSLTATESCSHTAMTASQQQEAQGTCSTCANGMAPLGCLLADHSRASLPAAQPTDIAYHNNDHIPHHHHHNSQAHLSTRSGLRAATAMLGRAPKLSPSRYTGRSTGAGSTCSSR